MHDTSKSTSLLTLLNAKSAFLVTTCPLPDPTFIRSGSGLNVTRVTVNGGKATAIYMPKLGDSSSNLQSLRCDMWWQQVVYANVQATRKDIVLGAANKDGGAHVDFDVSDQYAAARKGSMTVRHTVDGEVKVVDLQDSHLADLRQMAYELLISPELAALANS